MYVNNNLAQVKTYVGEDGKLHFVDSTGADSVLNFSSINVSLDKAVTYKAKSSATFNLSKGDYIAFGLGANVATGDTSSTYSSMSATNGTITRLANTRVDGTTTDKLGIATCAYYIKASDGCVLTFKYCWYSMINIIKIA